MKKRLYLPFLATGLLSGCFCAQSEPISKHEAAAMEQESRNYHRRLPDIDIAGHTIFLEKVSTRNGKKHTQRIPLTRQEQGTIRTLICSARSVKKAPAAAATAAQDATLLVCTDARGKRIFAEEVHMVPWSSVSKDGYAEGAYLALHDDYYPLWQHIINRTYPKVTVQEDTAAAAQHRQTVSTLQEQLPHCTSVNIQTLGHTCYFIRFGKLNKKQTAELCGILSRAKPLPFKGRIQGLSPATTTLFFYNAEGQEIGRLEAETITDAAAARTPQQCTATESMYLPRKDYKRLQHIISQQKDYDPTSAVSQ